MAMKVEDRVKLTIARHRGCRDESKGRMILDSIFEFAIKGNQTATAYLEEIGAIETEEVEYSDGGEREAYFHHNTGIYERF